jgi:hypothetical protein
VNFIDTGVQRQGEQAQKSNLRIGLLRKIVLMLQPDERVAFASYLL